jgi:hypothetical protein
MAALVPVLAVILVLVLHRSATLGAVVAAESPDVTTPAAEPPEVQIRWETPPEYWISGRDPMKTAASPTQATRWPSVMTSLDVRNHLEIRGVLCGKDRSTALIGNLLVHAGDEVPGVAGLRVSSIDESGVEFELAGKKWKQSISSSTSMAK